jgi:hypothetical protein
MNEAFVSKMANNVVPFMLLASVDLRLFKAYAQSGSLTYKKEYPPI